MGFECPNFIKKYLPEFTYESTLVVFIIKIVLIAIIAVLMSVFEVYLDERIFDTGSKITWESMAIVVIFNIVTAFFVIIYVPYMWHIVPFWYSLTISLIYLGLMVFFIICTENHLLKAP